MAIATKKGKEKYVIATQASFVCYSAFCWSTVCWRIVL